MLANRAEHNHILPSVHTSLLPYSRSNDFAPHTVYYDACAEIPCAPVASVLHRCNAAFITESQVSLELASVLRNKYLEDYRLFGCDFW